MNPVQAEQGGAQLAAPRADQSGDAQNFAAMQIRRRHREAYRVVRWATDSATGPDEDLVECDEVSTSRPTIMRIELRPVGGRDIARPDGLCRPAVP